MSSRPKRQRAFLPWVLGVGALVIFANSLLTLYAAYEVRKLRVLVRKTETYNLRVKGIFFNVFSGLSLKGVTAEDGQAVLFSADRVHMGFDLWSLRSGKVLVKSIAMRRPKIYLDNISGIADLFGYLARHAGKNIGFFETTHLRADDLRLGEVVSLDLRGYVSLIKESLILSRGEITAKRIVIPAVPDLDVFAGSHFMEPFDYVFDAEFKEGDFVLSRLELSNPALRFLGKGRLVALESPQPQIDLDVHFANIILDDFPVFNHEHLQSRGVIDAVLKVTGPLTESDAVLNVNLSNANFSFFDALFLSKVSGAAVLTQDNLAGRGILLNVNNIPCAADFDISQGEYPRLTLRLASLPKTGDESFWSLDLGAELMETELAGTLKTRVRHASPEQATTMEFDLKDFHLGYDDDLFINARDLSASIAVDTAAAQAPQRLLGIDFELHHLFGVVRRQEDAIVLDHLKATAYGGILEGEIDLRAQGEGLRVWGQVHLRDVDLAEFFQSRPQPPAYTLGGTLDADLKFDNALVEMLKGQMFFSQGTIEENPILNAVADFLGVSSLRKVDFEDLSVFFSGGRGEYTSRVQLTSPQVNGTLEGSISDYDKMDGYLSVSIATPLLSESKYFKKLLTYIRHDEPSVTFPFKISSYVSSPRILWLKNEFKDKIQNLLPERNKRFLQGLVNQMFEGSERAAEEGR